MKKIAVFFPGIGYHVDKPLLYYSKKLAKEKGYECFDIAYTCKMGNLCGNEERIKEAFYILYGQAKKQLDDIDFSQYDEVLFISKSIGTAIAAAYAKEIEKYFQELVDVDGYGRCRIKLKNILYTPLKLTFLYEPHNAIAFTGTNDPWVETEQIIRECEKNNIPLFVIDKVNHSLEGENVPDNINILKDVMKKTEEFL